MNTLNYLNSPVYGAGIFQSKNASKKTTTDAVKNNNAKSENVTNVLCDKNYGVLQTKKMNVSFKGAVTPQPLNNVSKKVNNLFNILRSNDIIVAAPNYPKAVESLKSNIDNIKTVIKRVFFVEDKSLDRVIGFKKNQADREAINLSDTPLMLRDSKKDCCFLNKGESGYLVDGDVLNEGKYEITIQEIKDTVLPIKDSYTFFIDMDKEVLPKIKEINETSLSKMEVAEKKETTKSKKITFADVGGIDGTIKELKKTIVYPIKHPELRNGNMKKSLLLYGPPGTGKSLVAEACANEAGAWYKKINASQLESKWVGESEENWRNLFAEAKKNQPAIIFIDEIDAIAKQRSGKDPYGDKTLNTILGLMSDSEKQGDNIYMIAATNRPNMLDDAIMRAGRFGHKIEVKAPDLEGTENILKIYTKNEPISKDLDLKTVAENLHKQNATGADIALSVEDARANAIERENIYEKIENNTYTPEDMENVTIIEEDFNKAIETLKNNKISKDRKPIGFASEMYK